MSTSVPSLATLAAAATHYFGEPGAWAYAAFADLRRRYFDARLPVPLIQWALTGHSRCIGTTGAGGGPLATRRGPVVTLHPSLLGGRQKPDPWGIAPSLLGFGYAYDVLLHELTHVNVHYVVDPHGERSGATSHNADPWVEEVNRIAPLLGFGDARASRSKVRRVKGVDGASRVVRGVEPGAVDFEDVAGFPHAFRQRLGATSFYRDHRCADAFGFAL